ncbi:type II toxin-antitoxin system VapC family toxin [Aliirhizobium smilacinae]|uniref:Type II toxin-antitoxin system VapC family toxin n=1 Tax=Aliirhizobium smilacinae TaxID=1395944 RepID=A0A5C4XT89_9HYPH|nr:type II toxin-antitoxin system VapC family toxin [Rhizobium smilacinae]TNM66311.1 type II toxin-antitoxin system VapC family toxin [Rhizobium smilacinae]
MRILLDTHLLIWLVGASERLPSSAREAIENSNNQLFFSAASIWELSTKQSTGRARLELPPEILHRQLLDNHFDELPVTATHGLAVCGLEQIHKDPFDRILIAQAMSEGMLLLTSDETIARYNGPIRLVR